MEQKYLDGSSFFSKFLVYNGSYLLQILALRINVYLPDNNPTMNLGHESLEHK